MKKYRITLTSLFFITVVIASFIQLYNYHTLNINRAIEVDNVGKCTTSEAAVIETKCQSTESEQAIKVVEEFLKWYKGNYGKISEFSLGDTSGEFYSVDLSTCEEY